MLVHVFDLFFPGVGDKFGMSIGLENGIGTSLVLAAVSS